MAYGTAGGPDDIERYYTDIRGGRAPSPEHLQELQERYAAIGNVFPLLDTTTRAGRGPRRAAERRRDGETFRAYLGMKHSPPFIPDGVAPMRDDGIERGIGIVMAPHWSGMSVETYVERVAQAVDDDGETPAFSFVRSYHDHPAFIAFLTARVREALDAAARRGARGRRRDLHRALAAGAHARRRLAAVQVLRLRRLVPLPRRAAGDGRPGGRASSAWRTTRSRGRAPAAPPTRGGARRSRT